MEGRVGTGFNVRDDRVMLVSKMHTLKPSAVVPSTV